MGWKKKEKRGQINEERASAYEIINKKDAGKKEE